MFWHELPHIDTFKSIGRHTRFDKGEALPLGRNVYFLERGLAALTMLTPSGDEKVYMYFKSGNLLGFIRFTLPQELLPSSYISINCNSIVAKSPLEVWGIDNKIFFQELENNPTLYKDLSFSISQNLSNVLEHSYWLASKDASTRLCLMLVNFMEEREGKLVLPRCFTYREMSNFLSIHTVTIAKICKILVDQGVLERNGHCVHIADPQRLHQIAREETTLNY